MTSKDFDLVLGLIVDVAFSFTNFRPVRATRFPEFRFRIRRRLPTFESGLNSSTARCPSRPSPGSGSSPGSEENKKTSFYSQTRFKRTHWDRPNLYIMTGVRNIQESKSFKQIEPNQQTIIICLLSPVHFKRVRNNKTSY